MNRTHANRIPLARLVSRTSSVALPGLFRVVRVAAKAPSPSISVAAFSYIIAQIPGSTLQPSPHTQHTHLSFRAYARIAPESWLIQRDIIEAREKMNLLTWDQVPAERRKCWPGRSSTKRERRDASCAITLFASSDRFRQFD